MSHSTTVSDGRKTASATEGLSVCRERPLWRSVYHDVAPILCSRNATEGVPYRHRCGLPQIVAATVVCLSLAPVSFAAGPNPTKPASKGTAPSKAEPPVAAMVGDEPVYVAEVDDILAGAHQTKDAAADLRGPAQEQAINRRLVAQYLTKEGYAIDEGETAELLKELKRKLEVQQISFDDFLERHAFSELMVRRRLQWDAMWAQFLKNSATDEALEEYFQLHRRDFDGTQLRVGHILWPVKPADDAEKLAAAIKVAEEVRSQIVSKQMTFAAAAKKYSSGPSRRNGGDLGFISRHDLMSEAFSRAAFDLQPNEVSKPVVDQFGVHLIACTDVKPGEHTWRDARRELFAAFSVDRFLELAGAQRKHVDVQIIDGVR
jgi:parvulin-like peptidyl-prolyl isomerase